MEINVGDIPQCEEQLKTTLHCDDKEKLRRKLALLQREYLRTAQRLQRAERSEAVRRHVRSRIEQQNQQDQREREVASERSASPPVVTVNTCKGTATGVPQENSQENNGNHSDSENSRRSQSIRFLLPSDSASPQTPDPCNDPAKGHRSSPNLRLRSRRSRLRLERRSSVETGRSSDNGEEGREQSERLELDTAGTEGGQNGVKTPEVEVVNESEELNGAESESPSLVLTHWNTCGQTETGNMEGKEAEEQHIQKEKEMERDKESTSLLPPCQEPAEREQKGTQCGKMEEKEGESDRKNMDGGLCEDSSEKDGLQNATENKSEKCLDRRLEIKEEKSGRVGAEQDVKAASLLDSCTLVEGLLFPAEYYVRTTRRMSSSQSQPDMQAVIHTQLGRGRPRRSRGRGRGLIKRSNSHEGTAELSQTDFSSPTAASPAAGLSKESPAEMNTQSSCEVSDQAVSSEGLCTPNTSATRPARGRRRRGRGRGRPSRCSLSLDTNRLDSGHISSDLQLTNSPVSAPPSLCKADRPKACLTPGESDVIVLDPPKPALTHSTATNLPPGEDGAPCSSSPGPQEKVYPIFLRSSGMTSRPSETNRSPPNWKSLLLPSSSQSQTSLLPLPSLSSYPLLNDMLSFDIPQDFHLPDDQFASLKLLKLRRVAVESAVEQFLSPPCSTRRSVQHNDAPCSPVMAHPLPLSLTPKIMDSPHQTEAEQAAMKSENIFMEQPLNEESSLQLECQTRTISTKSVSLAQDCVVDSVDQRKGTETVILNSPSQTDNSINRLADHPVNSHPHITVAGSPAGKVNHNDLVQSDELQIIESSIILLDDQTDCADNSVIQKAPHQQTKAEDGSIIRTLTFDSPLLKTPKKLSRKLTARNESPLQHRNVNSPAKAAQQSPERTTSPARVPSVQTQLLLSPLLASVPGRFITPHLPPSFAPTSPTLPSLGPTPHPVPASLPLTSSPSAPALTLPPPHSPSTQNLSPPPLSPCLSPTFFSPSQPTNSSRAQIQVSCEPSQNVEPAACLPVSNIQDQRSGVQVGVSLEETKKERTITFLHTLKAPAGGCLVDACCLTGPSGGLCVAAAGKWAVCLWSQTAASDWSLTHTWAFNEPVINVFPVPDTAGLICVTLGQLEIREVRVLWGSSLSQALLCAGLVQAVVCLLGSRVVTSSPSACGSTLQVFTLSDSGSSWSAQPLAPPGVCVGALALVNGLSDALIGTDEAGCLFVWNLKTGQLLKRIALTDSLKQTACLRGFSYCGVLFVLLQHHFLSSLDEEERDENDKGSEEEKRTVLFSLVAVNPLSRKSVLATQLYPPKAWSGRLCEADVSGSSVVGLSQSGCVCVWELGCRGGSKMLWCPESEGWQLARWGGRSMLLTGHHNGDVSLHCCSTKKDSVIK